jgi:hypothetical protein
MTETPELAEARARQRELMDRMQTMDPAAVDEMTEFLRSLPTGILRQLRDEAAALPHE